MIRVNRKLLLSIAICGLTLCLLPANGQAISTARTTTPHVTVRSAPRVSPGRTSPRINTRTTPPRTSPRANINKGPTSPVRTAPKTSTRTGSVGKNGLTSNNNINRSIGNINEYSSLTNRTQKSSYTKWSNYYARNYPGRSANSIYNSYYYWIPYWILLDNQRKNVASANIPTDNQGNPRRWIKVGDKIIFVPENIWKKVNKGDKVKLIDDEHIKINDKVYKR